MSRIRTLTTTLLCTFCFFTFLILPTFVEAQNQVATASTTVPLNQDGTIVAGNGFVPCSGAGCDSCHVLIVINTLIKWLIGLSFLFFAALAFAAGFKMVMAGGNSGALQDAKSSFTNAFIGLFIILAAWLMVDTLMRGILKGGTGDVNGYGPWSEIECGGQVVPGIVAGFIPGDPEYTPTPNASRGVANPAAQGQLNPAQIAALAALSGPDDKIAAQAAALGLDATQVKNLQALMRVESGGCRNNTSPVGAVGCMQVMPTTARSYVSALQGKSDAEVIAWLMNQDNNIALGTKIYSDLYKKYGGDEAKVFAAYNGGAGANTPSRDCPGQVRWQCVWDSPGCYGTSNTNCTPNTGYVETRNYVLKIPAVAKGL